MGSLEGGGWIYLEVLSLCFFPPNFLPDPIISGLQSASNNVDLQKEGVKGYVLDSSSREAA